MALCANCGVLMPVQTGPGARRKKCEQCSPKQKLGPRHIPQVTVLPSAELAGAPKGKLAAATREKLAELGRENTPEGTAALMAAEQLDSGRMTGAAYASLLKAFLATMDAATKGITGGSSALDELRKRRDKRRNSA